MSGSERELAAAQRTASEAVERTLALARENQKLRGELGRFVRAMRPGGPVVQHSCGLVDTEEASGPPGSCSWCHGESGDVWYPMFIQTPATGKDSTGALPSGSDEPGVCGGGGCSS